MRKVFSGVLVMTIVLLSGTTTVFAAGPGCGYYFTDADGDGICDNANGACIYADMDGDGICDVCGANHESCLTGCGYYFTDADGDGICDHYADGQAGGNGWGNGVRDGHGHGHGFRGGHGR